MGVGIKVIKYFAPMESVEKMNKSIGDVNKSIGATHELIKKTTERSDKRHEAGVAEQKVYRQQQSIEQFEDGIKFQRKEGPPGASDKDELKRKREKLEELKKERDRKINIFEQAE